MGSGYGLVIDVILSSIFWTVLQIILFQWPDLEKYKMKRFAYIDTRNRMVSFIHGIFCIALSFIHYFVEPAYCGS